MRASLRQRATEVVGQATTFSALDIIALPTVYGRAKTTDRNESGTQRGCKSHHQSPDNDHAHPFCSCDKNLFGCHILSIPV